MRVEISLDQRSIRRWQVELVRRLSKRSGVAVGVRWASQDATATPSCIDTLFRLERAVHGVPDGLSLAAEATDFAPYVGEGGVRPDLVIDLAGGQPSAGARRWRLTFDGEAGEVPALAALLDGRGPVVTVSDSETGAVLARSLPGTESPDILVASFEELLGRVTALVVSALDGSGPMLDARQEAGEVGCARVAAFGAATLPRAALARMTGLASRRARPRIG